MTTKPGWFLFDGLLRLDVTGGPTDRFRCDEGVSLSEAQMAPRAGGTREDDGWLIPITTDVVRDSSEVWIFDASRIGDGPCARLALPERVCHGTHACWSSGGPARPSDPRAG